MLYEIFYLIGESREADLDKIKNKVLEILKNESADFVGVEISEKRKLAYKINRDIRGTYVARRFNLPNKDDKGYDPEKISNITRNLNLFSDILRFTVVRAEKLPELKEKEVKIVEKKPSRVQKFQERILVAEKMAAKKEEKTEEKVSEPKKATEEVKLRNEKEKDEKVEVSQEKSEKEPMAKKNKKEISASDDIDRKLDEILKI